MGFHHLICLALVIASGCSSSQPEGQAEAIRKLQQLTNARGERMILEGVGTGKITAIVPLNLGKGGGWNDDDFLASVPYLRRIPELHTLRFINTHVVDTGLSGLEELPQLRELYFHVNPLSDGGLKHMQYLVNLEALTCDTVRPLKEDGKGTDQTLNGTGVKYLRRLPKLVSLDLSGAAINNEGAQEISQLPHLKRLKLAPANLITDQGVAFICTMANLADLQIDSSRITDEALESLSKMTQLKSLVVGGKRLTSAGKALLQQQLHETKIVFSKE